MDHIEFANGLKAREKVTLKSRNRFAGLLHLMGHAAMIFVLSVIVMSGGLLGGLAMMPLGIALVFLFALEHEATHKTPFENARMNEVVGFVCGVILLLPFQWFRYFHLAHHRHTNDPDKDPELMAGGAPDTRRGVIWHVTGIPYWRGMIRKVWRNAFGENRDVYVPAPAKRRVKREAQVMIGIYAGVALLSLFSPVLIWVWIFPTIIGQPVLRMYLLAEHGRCAFVANMLANTRTTYTNRLVRFLAWNMPYHVEHHTFPNVPFYNLPKVNELMDAHLIETADGYIKFNAESYRDLT
jgi:fatty acid desaturase